MITMSDDDPWTAWSRDVNAQLKRLHERTRTVQQGLVMLVNLRAVEKGLPPPIVSKRDLTAKPKYRVKAGVGITW